MTFREEWAIAREAGGFWGMLDALMHELRLPSWSMRWVCDRYDNKLFPPDDNA